MRITSKGWVTIFIEVIGKAGLTPRIKLRFPLEGRTAGSLDAGIPRTGNHGPYPFSTVTAGRIAETATVFGCRP
ncbi:MAG: hypothetical protein H6Q00_1076 [Holophagaceae bacterium]|nr:hypothetical protein [Holophagaceae bacterium]